MPDQMMNKVQHVNKNQPAVHKKEKNISENLGDQKDKELLMNSAKCNNEGQKGGFKNCIYCSTSLHPSNYEKHIKSCKIYHKFMKKTNYGFQCLVCKNEISLRNRMYAHIKKEHLNTKEKSVKTISDVLAKSQSQGTPFQQIQIGKFILYDISTSDFSTMIFSRVLCLVSCMISYGGTGC